MSSAVVHGGVLGLLSLLLLLLLMVVAVDVGMGMGMIGGVIMEGVVMMVVLTGRMSMGMAVAMARRW